MSIVFLEGAEYEAAMQNSDLLITTTEVASAKIVELQAAKQRIIELEQLLEQLAEKRLQMIRERNTQIAVLQNHVAALQDIIKDLKKRLIVGTVTEQR